jgi:hypothetical protein
MWAIKLSKAINIRLIRLENGKENNFEVAVKLLPEIQLILTDQNAVNRGKHLESAGKNKKKKTFVRDSNACKEQDAKKSIHFARFG